MGNDSETPDPNQLSPEWIKSIRLRARAMRQTPDTDVNAPDPRPNNDLNRQILQAWKQGSPRMWARLTAVSASFPLDLATVLQQEMWDMQQQLMDSGMPYTDAQEQAERETLMLEPEEPDEDDTEMWTPDLPLPQ